VWVETYEEVVDVSVVGLVINLVLTSRICDLTIPDNEIHN